ncbi:hypothetical protein DFJ63DRAFT_337895 [Scheffersomyces coipomensis]|uniref:uncharacterized protein n=1 Tax=Scheffersomyces coipomensis TaxID=1788519 RepID=UPI00315CD1B4
MMMDSNDFDYLQLTQLNQQFDRILENQPINDNHRQKLIQIALTSLQVMEKYSALQPKYVKFIDYLKTEASRTNTSPSYNIDWIDSDKPVNNSLLIQLDLEFKNLLLYPSSNHTNEINDDDESDIPNFSSSGDSSTSTNSKDDLFNRFKQVLIINIIKRKFSQNVQLIITYSSIHSFNLSPRDITQVKSNNFLQFLFYQYYNNLNAWSSSPIQLKWPNQDDTPAQNPQQQLDGSNRTWVSRSTAPTNISTSSDLSSPFNNSNSFKILDAIYAKAVGYYTKIEPILSKINKTNTSNEDYTGGIFEEIHYYWLIRFYNLTILFKKFEFYEFNKEFESLFLNSTSPTSPLSNNSTNTNATSMGFSSSSSAVNTITIPNPSLQFLIDLPTLKSDIFSMYAIVSIFIKPFKALSFLEKDAIIDTFNINDSTLDTTIYTNVLLPLSNAKLSQVHEFLTSRSFLIEFGSNLEYLLPINDKQSGSGSFISYVIRIIDFKSFLLIISITKQIPRIKLFEMLGYINPTPEVVSNLTASLLNLMGILGLGKLGIGYKVDQELFFNQNQGIDQKFANDLQIKINELTNDVYGDSVATLMKGILTEKFFK